MKTLYRLPIALILCFFALQLHAQEDTEGYKNYFWLKWGFNTGVSWQTSDVDCRLGPGWGSTLEIPLIQSRRGNVVLGLRGRYLWTRTFGQDWERSTTVNENAAVNGTLNPDADYTGLGYYYANHRTSAHEWSGELNLTFQPAYDRSGFYANIFAGLGANGYKVNVEQADLFSPYNYSTISTDNETQARRDLRDLYFIKNWETEGVQPNRPHWVLAPSLGVGLGYKVSKHFSFGWEYKLTFPLTDDFDGQRFAGLEGRGRDGNDIYHYTSLGLNVHFGGGGSSSGQVRTNDRPTTNYTTYNPPTISVLYPGPSQLNITGNCVSDFRVQVRNVSRKSKLALYINNRLIPQDNFDFDPASGYMTFRANLNRGSNSVKVIASNNDGRREETVRLTCGQAIVTPPQNEVMTVCIPTGPNSRETRVINRRDWSYYQSMGAVPGPCPQPVREIAICVYDPYAPMGSQTLIIPESEWPYYQQQGASRGACSNQAMTICVTDPQNPMVRSTMTISSTAWPWYASQGASQGPCPQICTCLTICMVDQNAPGGATTLTIRQDEWPQYQALGAVLGPCNNNEIVICYKEPCSSEAPISMRIKESAWPWYQQRGATRGPCPDVRINICLPDENAPGGSRTLSIREEEWPRYQAQGASWGACSNNFITICYPTANGNRVTMSISETAWNYFRNRGAVRGVCPPETMTICVPDPNMPGGSRTMTVSETEWPYYQSQGAVRGECSPTQAVICWPNPTTGEPQQLSVSTTTVQWYIGQGATRGPCPASQMTICLPDPANGGSRTLLINTSEWSRYQAQGAVQGPCTGENITICWKPGTEVQTTLTIPASLWSWYQSQGAVRGACVPPNVVICLPDPTVASGSRQLTVPQAQLSYYLSQGAVQGACGTRLLEICWENPANPGTKTQMMIPANMLPYYQSQGASTGKCPEENIKICLPDPLARSGGRTVTIKRSEWPRYEAMGAVQGACAGQMTVCLPSGNPVTYNTVNIFANLWPFYQTQGAAQGNCPEPQVILCLPDQTAPGGSRQLTVNASEVDAYLARGAVRGGCSSNTMIICFSAGRSRNNGEEMQISTSVWPYYQSQGATEGPCPEAKIKICLPDPTSVSGGRVLEIPASSWATYQAQGAVKGDCGKEFMMICYADPKKGKQPVTMNIPKTLWPHYQSLGAKQGACRERVVVVDSIQICMPDRNAETGGRQVTIAAKDFPTYQAQGAVRGACGASIEICMPSGMRSGNSQTIKIPANLMAHYEGLGATRGKCPAPDITICLPDPLDPAGGKTLTISEDDLPIYKAQGAIVGPCEGTVAICWPDPNATEGKRTLNVPEGLLGWYIQNGGTEGKCPDPPITICLPDPNAPGGSRELTIQQSELISYMNQGATQGRCDANTTTICYNDQTISVSNTVTSWFLNQGAQTGNCPEPVITICMPNPNVPGGSEELTIAQSQWTTYQAQGAVQGTCNGNTTTLCYNDVTITVSNSVASWYTQNGALSGACPEPQITICVPDENAPNGSVTMTIAQSQWPNYQAQGAVQGSCAATTSQLCYNNATVTVSTSVVPHFLQMGATTGACPEPQITICVPDENAPNGSITMTIPQSQWPTYQAQGAVQGSCAGGTSPLCYNSQTITVSTTVVPHYLQLGATTGACPEPTITICLPDPMAPMGSQQMTIPQSQWSTYQAQGATQGNCAGTTSLVCYQNATMTISSTVLNWYLQNGATSGECQPTMITICLPDPNSPNGSQQLTISQSQWPTYQAQGAVQGSCSGTTATLCYQGSNITVSTTVRDWFLNNGATNGPCSGNGGGWDRSSVAVTGSCNGSIATFQVTNTGQLGQGDMLGTTAYRWYENNTLAASGTLQLQGGETQIMTRASNGMNIRLEVDQRPGHPGNSRPRADVTCGGTGDDNGRGGNETSGKGEAKITICNVPPSDPRNPKTMEIKEKDWAKYSQTSTKGACDLRMVKMCINGSTDNVPAASSDFFKRQGAQMGECPEAKITICNVPPSDPRRPQTLTIKESELRRYQMTSTTGPCDMRQIEICNNGKTERIPAASLAYFKKQGAIEGACRVVKIKICSVPPADPRNPKTLEIDENDWTKYARSATKGACNMSPKQICLNGKSESIPMASWDHFRRQGATEGRCPIQKITICNVPPANPSAPQTISINETDWARYASQAHKGSCLTRSTTICYQGKTMTVPASSFNVFYSKKGAKQGACVVPKIAICNVPPSNPAAPKNLQIEDSQWSNYAASSHKGACNMNKITICYRNNTMSVPTSSWNLFYSKNGGKQGACPTPKIAICNVPPANPAAPQNMQIEDSQWSRYAATSHTGACNMTKMTICYAGKTLSVPTSSWNVFYSKKGGKTGACPVPKITICNVPPANPAAPKTLQIEESQWSKYAATSHKGACNGKKMTICYNAKTLSVPTSSWNVFYSKKGAKQGVCPTKTVTPKKINTPKGVPTPPKGGNTKGVPTPSKGGTTKSGGGL